MLPMGLSLNLMLGSTSTNTGTADGVSDGNFNSFFNKGECSTAAKNGINAGADVGRWLVLGFACFTTASVCNDVINGGGVEAVSGLSLELTLRCGNYATQRNGSGTNEGINGAANSVFSDNSSVLKKRSTPSDGNSAYVVSGIVANSTGGVNGNASADVRRSSSKKPTPSKQGKQGSN